MVAVLQRCGWVHDVHPGGDDVTAFITFVVLTILSMVIVLGLWTAALEILQAYFSDEEN